MFEKLKRLFIKKNTQAGRDRSEHRQHTLLYEDLCQ